MVRNYTSVMVVEGGTGPPELDIITILEIGLEIKCNNGMTVLFVFIRIFAGMTAHHRN